MNVCTTKHGSCSSSLLVVWAIIIIFFISLKNRLSKKVEKGRSSLVMNTITSYLGDTHSINGVIACKRFFQFRQSIWAFCNICDDGPSCFFSPLEAFGFGHDEVDVDFCKCFCDSCKASWFIVKFDVDFDEVVCFAVDGADGECVCFGVDTHEYFVSFFEIKCFSEFVGNDESSSCVEADDGVHSSPLWELCGNISKGV